MGHCRHPTSLTPGLSEHSRGVNGGREDTSSTPRGDSETLQKLSDLLSLCPTLSPGRVEKQPLLQGDCVIRCHPSQTLYISEIPGHKLQVGDHQGCTYSLCIFWPLLALTLARPRWRPALPPTICSPLASLSASQSLGLSMKRGKTVVLLSHGLA